MIPPPSTATTVSQPDAIDLGDITGLAERLRVAKDRHGAGGVLAGRTVAWIRGRHGAEFLAVRVADNGPVRSGSAQSSGLLTAAEKHGLSQGRSLVPNSQFQKLLQYM